MEPSKRETKETPRKLAARAESATLLSSPTNVATRRLFVAASRMNEGKTTTCLGLFAALQTLFPRVGFIKPVGQRFVEIEGLKIDEDSYLLDAIYNVCVPIESMSPVAVDSKFTRRYLEEPERLLPLLTDKICRAFDRVSWEKDFTLIEGTGHAGVGAVFDLSNARVARLLKAKAIVVTSGGIGRPVDEVALNKALFDKEGVEVVGAILNKVSHDKIDVVREFAGSGLKRLGVPLLGVLPVQTPLTAPNLAQIVEETAGRWLNNRSSGLITRVERIVIGAMTARGVMDKLGSGTLVITPGDREDIILALITSVSLSGKKSLAGLLLTGDVLPHPKLMELLGQTAIPVIASAADSYEVASKIHDMTVKTQPQDVDKIPIIKRLILENVDLKALAKAV